ncbi:hypothetical protein [Bartonella sp. CL436QHHD]
MRELDTLSYRNISQGIQAYFATLFVKGYKGKSIEPPIFTLHNGVSLAP